jgi:hypothetical protein
VVYGLAALAVVMFGPWARSVRESGAGRYEVRDYQGGRLKAIVWVEPGKPELVMTTIAAGRIEALAAALAEYVAGGPADAE